MQCGDMTIISISDGSFGLDGGAMFGIVPRPLWERVAPPDEQNRIRCAANLLLLIAPRRRILIDCGLGQRYSDKERRIYAIEHQSADALRSLALHGVGPEDITDVIVSHLHFDHQGGAVEERDGRLRPVYPRAIYHYQRSQVEWARHPTVKDRGSFRSDDFEPVFAAGQAEVHDGGWLLDGSVRVEVSDGHTTGLQVVHVESGGRRLVYCSDLIPLRTHVRLPYLMGYDLRPLVTLEEKARLLQRAVSGGWWLCFEHDPMWVAATIRTEDRDFTPDVSLDRETFNQP